MHETGILEMERLGGLMKRMPCTGATFLVGAAAICGLPPLNGFVSEFLIYFGAYKGILSGSENYVLGIIVISALALIGGLAAACFAKAFGTVFLGVPRSIKASNACEVSMWMKLPQVCLAAGCVIIGFGGWFFIKAINPVIKQVTKLSVDIINPPIASASHSLLQISIIAFILIALILLLTLVRRMLTAGRRVDETLTWDCGYVKPTERMQYTASSFAQPLTTLFGFILRTVEHKKIPEGYF